MPEYSVNLGLSAIPEVSQRENPQVFVEFVRIRNALNLLLSSLDTYTGALTPVTTAPAETTRIQNIFKALVKAGAALSPGQYVYLHNVAGVLTADLAQAGVNSAWGFVSSTSNVSAGALAEISFGGVNSHLSGLTLAATYYLSAGTPGAISTVVSTQQVGRALSATDLLSSPL